jgi:CheY-like chemotaxis protein
MCGINLLVMDSKNKNLVFIVDDDPDDRQIILDAFLENDKDIDYVFIESAAELLESLHSEIKEKPDLILLDLNMPGVLGLQALKEIRNNKTFSQIPIVVLTTSNLQMDRKLSYEFGASCFLTKPDTFKKLTEIVNAIMILWLFSTP